jgi:DNA modification methylase
VSGPRDAILVGDVLEKLRELPDGCVQTVVTSPPYWNLRDYGMPGQIGLEPTIGEYVERIVAVFREIRRVLRDDGTMWLNLGDSYAREGGTQGGGNRELMHLEGTQRRMTKIPAGSGLKPKDLIGQPWRVAFALQADGWYLRSEIIWHKPNPMPESVTDRPTKSHEQIFLLSKSERYFFDNEAVRESAVRGYAGSRFDVGKTAIHQLSRASGAEREESSGRNVRSVWTIPTAPYPEAHFATFPPEIPKRCILAGTSAKGACAECGAPWERIVETGELAGEANIQSGDRPAADVRGVSATGLARTNGRTWRERKETGWRPTCDHADAQTVQQIVLDPFLGSGTTAAVAQSLGRSWIGIELSPVYADLARKRIAGANLALPLA